MGVEGEDLVGVYHALDYLFRIYAHELGYLPSDAVYPTGRRVLVVGAGLTAIDAAVEARLRGAEYVAVSYRRTINEAPAGRQMIEKEIIGRGITWMELTNPRRFIGVDGRLTAVEFQRFRLGAPDASGRPAPEPIPGSEFVEEFDQVLLAIGEIPTPPFKEKCDGLGVGRGGAIAVDESGRTGMRGVFAAGDVVTGPTTIGKAMSHGMRVAESVIRWINEGRP